MICLVGVEGGGTVGEAILRLLLFVLLDKGLLLAFFPFEAFFPVFVARVVVGGMGAVGAGVGLLATTGEPAAGGAPESWLPVEEVATEESWQ